MRACADPEPCPNSTETKAREIEGKVRWDMGHGQFIGDEADKGGEDQILALPPAGHVTWGQPYPTGPGFLTGAMKWLSGRRKKKAKELRWPK